MRVAIIGSRTLKVKNIEKYLTKGITEIVSGGAKGIDSCAKIFAEKSGIPLKEFIPDYQKFGKYAPLKRNIEIIQYCDEVIAFWNGKLRGTKYVIDNCAKYNKKVKVYLIKKE